MYLLGVLALGFYAFKIPERYFPGTCGKLYGQCMNTLRAVVSPGWALLYKGRETTVSNRLLFRQALTST